ncbi:zf-CCHC domain-containing protein [Tanacetum coccineum]
MKEDKKEKEDRRCFKCGDTNHFISDCPKHSFNDQKVFVRDVGSISEETSRKMKFVSWHMTTMRELNIAKDLRLPEEDNDCMKIKTCEEICMDLFKKQTRRTLYSHKEMDLETVQTIATAKLPILKQENGNSFKPIARTTANADGTSTFKDGTNGGASPRKTNILSSYNVEMAFSPEMEMHYIDIDDLEFANMNEMVE